MLPNPIGQRLLYAWCWVELVVVQMECSEWSPCLCLTKVPPPAGKKGHVERSSHTIYTTIFQRLPLSHTPHLPSFSFFFLFISFSPPHTPQPLPASHHPLLSIATVRHCRLAIRSSIVIKKRGKFPFYFILFYFYFIYFCLHNNWFGLGFIAYWLFIWVYWFVLEILFSYVVYF